MELVRGKGGELREKKDVPHSGRRLEEPLNK